MGAGHQDHGGDDAADQSQQGGLDDLSPVPRYQQIAAIIRDRIQSVELGEGDAIPSQKEIQDTYSVARATAAKALRVLTDEGIVVVVPGVGAKVARKPRGDHHGTALAPVRA